MRQGEDVSVVSEARPHRKLVIATVVVATFIGFFAVFAVWAKRQLLETDTWVNTSSRLLEDKDIQLALSGFLVDAIYSSVDVQGELQKNLPPQAQALAGPAAGALRGLAGNLALEALQRPEVQALWADANRQAHDLLVSVVKGGGETVATQGGDVTLDLGGIIEQVGDRAGIDVTGKVPPDVSQIVILHSDQLETAQDAVNALQKVAIILSFLGLGLYGLAIYLARGWRREAVRAAGIGFVVIGLLVLIARGIAGGYLVDSLTSTTSVEPAGDSVWSIGTSLLKDSALAMIGYGLVIVAGAWLASPGALAREARRAITPLVERRAIGYAFLALIVVLIFWWNPTPSTSRLIPSLTLIVLLIAGFEALRAQAVRDFPDQKWEAMVERWHASGSGLAARLRAGREARARGAKAAPLPREPERDRLDQLERLARLLDSGVLTTDEFEREKQRILV
jgi:hypothetical protein